MELKVRKATLKDLNSIMTIEKESFEAEITEKKEVFAERMHTFNEGFLVLTDHRDIPVGYISSELWQCNDEVIKSQFALGHSITDTHKARGKELYISSVALSRKLRGKGYGHILLDDLLERIKQEYPNVTSAILLVSNHWIRAQKMYLSRGFVKVEEIKDFFKAYGEAADGIIMRKNLGPGI